MLGCLDHYDILEVVGSGGFGVVLKARDTSLERIVAIKVLAESLAGSVTARKRFVREAKAAAAVRDDNVVSIYSVSDRGPVPYLVMEFVAGQPLDERLRGEGPLELAEILRIGQQTAVGLAAAHQHGLVHRDVKPANILLENGVQRVKITDFGLARAADDASLTQAGQIAGTPEFMSPEQARGTAIDRRSDLFSLGSVLYAMCTGLSPFRGSTTLGVIKRVCDDAPRPVREVNSNIPDWLAAFIDRLLAKSPDERFQTAAEVAEVLGQHLAQLQQPAVPTSGVAIVPKSALRASHSAFATRPWTLPAAVAFILLLLGISLTEATGITQVLPTVIRIVTGEGTLVVETDADVHVTLEGNGDLTFNLAGGQTIRAPSGRYRVKATKDGKQVPLERDLITISRGGDAVVRVRMEAATPAAVASGAERGAFVVLGGKGVVERRYDTLAEAVQGASDGHTIEIRGNGPFYVEPIEIGNRALTLRAGSGFRPSLQLDSPKVDALLTTEGPLVLEGLELVRRSSESVRAGQPCAHVLQTNGSEVHVTNCRLVRKVDFQGSCVISQAATTHFRNSELVMLGPTVGALVLYFGPTTGTLLVENCVGAGPRWGAVLNLSADNPWMPQVSVRLRNNTWAIGTALYVRPSSDVPQKPRLSIEADQNDFDVLMLLNYQPLKGPAAQPWEEIVPKMLTWRDAGSLYPTKVLLNANTVESPVPQAVIQDIAAWDRLWNNEPPGSLTGRPNFAGGDLFAIAMSGSERLNPEDFRLRADSPGYRAGKGGKDLGADIDLVGPGEAYERGKKTPDYQEWLKQTGQLRGKGTPEKQAFVILRAGGVEQGKFDTLAEAVRGASDGDTIEIRASGPFITEPVQATQALVIRAGKGFRPVIKLSPDAAANTNQPLLRTDAKLVLEGLELQRPPQPETKGQTTDCPVFTRGAPLLMANCRFIQQRDKVCIYADHSAQCVARNCEFLGGIAIYSPAVPDGATRILDNCVQVGLTAFRWFDVSRTELSRLSIQLTRDSIVVKWPALVYQQHALPDFSKDEQGDKPVHLEASGTVFKSDAVLEVYQFHVFPEKDRALSADEVEGLLCRSFTWVGRRNLYQVPGSYLKSSVLDVGRLAHGLDKLEDWKRFWTSPDVDSMEGRVRYQGGDLVSKLEAAAEQLTPADFRLREDSAGYHAGPDGKDLGADIDLVGPGAGYEQWKTTPEYQQWLKETGQTK